MSSFATRHERGGRLTRDESTTELETPGDDSSILHDNVCGETERGNRKINLPERDGREKKPRLTQGRFRTAVQKKGSKVSFAR